MHIVDRRLNPGGKSLANRQRFLRRAKDVVQRAVRERRARRTSRTSARTAGSPCRPTGCASRASPASPAPACRTTSCPATRSTSRATASSGRRAAAAAAAPARAATAARSEDDFRFVLTREEFLELFLEDLELPDLAKRRLAVVETRGAAPGRLHGDRLARQPRADPHDAQLDVAAHRAQAPKPEEVAALEAEIAELPDGRPGAAGPRRARAGDAARARASASPTSTRSTCATAASSPIRGRWRRR